MGYNWVMKIENPESASHETTFADGSKRNVTELETVFVGKGNYLPGWRWSKDVGAVTGKESERHVGFVISGSFGVRETDGTESVVQAGEAFELKPGADAWVIGDKPCVALDFEVKK